MHVDTGARRRPPCEQRGWVKKIFSKRMVDTATPWGFSTDYEKRNVQVYFFVSACTDTIIQYLKGELSSSIDTVGDVVIEAVEKLKRND